MAENLHIGIVQVDIPEDANVIVGPVSYTHLFKSIWYNKNVYDM